MAERYSQIPHESPIDAQKLMPKEEKIQGMISGAMTKAAQGDANPPACSPDTTLTGP